MHPLDDPKYRAKYDLGGVSNSLALLAEQVDQAWRESTKINIPKDYFEATEIVMNGMGGSGLVGHVVEAAFRNRLKVPFFLTHSYNVPAHVGKNSLFIISTYSGDTEEVLSSYDAAKKRNGKIIGLAAGGVIGNLIKTGKMPGYNFAPKNNPAGRPRFALGYSIFGILGILKRAKMLELSDSEIDSAIKILKDTVSKFEPNAKLQKNPAKRMAAELVGKIPVFVGAEFLASNARITSNQLHEGSKQFGFHFSIPELNHHLMEGLAFPRNVVNKLAFVFFPSDLYHERVQKRFPITEAVVSKHKIPFYEYRPSGSTQLEQIAELLSFGSYVTYYLGLLNKVDPSPNPWVDYFKEKLGRYK